MYTYNAELIRVVDGDTVWVRVDLGFYLYREIDLRIVGINAPEMKTPEGKVAKAFAQEWFTPGQKLIVQCEKAPGSYSRYSAIVTDATTGADFAKYMLDSGHAAPYVYKWS